MAFTLLVNGVEHRVEVASEATLLNVLRDNLGLTGAKYGCGEGQCGACTILVDGSPVRSCRMQVGAAAGKNIITIEGLAKNGSLHPVQQAFLEFEAFQCGYCTPGMILSAAALLQRTPHPSREQIITHMNGNVCRCGAYLRIIEAVQHAASPGKRTTHATAS
jgi:aerobic-type carbon monoxide dehydrogenase small subunit (CoxS/CutS family)